MSDELKNDPFDDSDGEEETTSAGPPKGEGAGVFGKWYVLYPLCALVLFGALYLGLELHNRMGAPIRVTLDTEPEDLIVLEQEKELVPADDGTYRLAPGKHELTFRKEGYESRTLECVVSATMNRFTVKLDPLSDRAVLVEVVPPDAQLRVNGVVRDTPNGKIELRAPESGSLLLQANHPDYRSFRKSYTADALKASDYRLRVELVPAEGGTGLPADLVVRRGDETDPELGSPRVCSSNWPGAATPWSWC